MYRVFLERAAEKDLKSLSSKLHNQVVTAFKNWRKILVLLVAES
jgi:mRNA-degrading endonuclease RelE of RelBE toxin-antitoxin system